MYIVIEKIIIMIQLSYLKTVSIIIIIIMGAQGQLSKSKSTLAKKLRGLKRTSTSSRANKERKRN